MKWWSPPKQRQRWHSPDVLPSDTDAWGQIFYDLFYVGGAYNLGNVLKYADYPAAPRSLLYFCATGLPSMVMWHDKLHFDARFTTRPGRDVVHRSIEIMQLCCVGTALSRIRSVEVESHPCNHIDILEFAAALLLNSMLTIARYVEVALATDEEPGARRVARREVLRRVPSTLFLVAATVESGMSYSGSGNSHDAGCPANERPIWYCLLSWAAGLATGYGERILLARRAAHVEETSVPLNVHFCMHRYGEWFMLMFGESIMSLLIVEGDNESLNHNLKFYAGILSVTFLTQLHFKSEPSSQHANHALSRSRTSNYLYTALLVPIYSMALIATGVSYKMFLFDYGYDDGNYHDGRKLGGNNGGYNAPTDDGLGNNDNSSYEHAEERQQDTADLFCRSLALVLVCTDINLLLHQGSQAVWDQIRSLSRCHALVLFSSKCSLLFFAVFMSFFRNDPHFMAGFGLCVILLQEVWRRCFKSWQQNGIDTSIFDDNGTVGTSGSTGSDHDIPGRTTTCDCSQIISSINITQSANDEDYAVQKFDSPTAALAKFEQEAIDEEAAKENESSPNKASRNGTMVDSYYKLPE